MSHESMIELECKRLRRYTYMDIYSALQDRKVRKEILDVPSKKQVAAILNVMEASIPIAMEQVGRVNGAPPIPDRVLYQYHRPEDGPFLGTRIDDKMNGKRSATRRSREQPGTRELQRMSKMTEPLSMKKSMVVLVIWSGVMICVGFTIACIIGG